MPNKQICIFTVDDRIFNKDALLKTAYLFIDRYYIYLSYDREHVVKIKLEAKPGENIRNIDKEFCNELLTQMLRYRIATENRNMKELILGRALFSTCLDSEDKPVSEEDLTTGCSLNDIAVDWFEVYEK